MKRHAMGFCGAVAFCVVMGVGASGVLAQDKPAAHAGHHHDATARVYAPYSKLSLTEDQKKQIAQVQAEYRAKIAALLTEERAKVASMLTDEQKKQLADMVEKMKEHRAEAAKNYREKRKAEHAQDAPAANDSK